MTISTTSTDQYAAAALREFPGLDDIAIAFPDDPGYDEARTAWNLAVDQRPAAVALPTSACEVLRIVRAARSLGLRVAPQSTGHNAGPLAAEPLDDVIILRTGALDEISVDPESKTVRVGGGVVWLPAVQAAAQHGLSVLHGSAVDVGVVGYTLGGGMGWYARSLGLAANSLLAVEIVTGAGEFIRVDADHHAEVFWALRGGGGNFGVVTAMEFRAYDFSTAYAGLMMWDISEARRVLDVWRRWAPAAPDEVTTSFRIMRIPPIPEVPEFLRGRSIVVIDGAVLADDEPAAAIIEPLRALAPELDTFGRVPSEVLAHLHMDPEEPAPGHVTSTMLRCLDDAGAAVLLDAVGPGVETPLMIVELRQLGGAVSRPHEGGGVLSHLAGEFALVCGGMAPSPEFAGVLAAAGAQVVAAMAPWRNGRSYLNFVEDPTDVRAGYPDDAWLRLVAVRSAADPDGVLVANHRIPRLYEHGEPTG